MRSRLFSTMFALTAAALFSTAAYAGGDHDKDHKAHAEVGQPAPTFTLTDHEGNPVDLADYTADEKIIVLEWFSPDCPFVVKHYQKSSTMNDLAGKYAGKDVVWLAIDSSHYVTADKTAKAVKSWDINHKVLLDPQGKVGHLYQAKTTPHMYIIDARGTLVYAGAIDNSVNTKAPPTDSSDYVNYVDQALGQLLAGETVTTAQTKPYGCTVKYGKQAAAASDKPQTAKACTKSEDGKACDKCAA